MNKIIYIIISVIIVSFLPNNLFAAEDIPEKSKMDEALWFYQHENYEEALVLFHELDKEKPVDKTIEYYLGVTYKQLQDYTSALPHLEAAAELDPTNQVAIIELIDLLYQSDKIDEAKEWIQRAEDRSINPGRIAFFKGLVLLKEGEDPQATIDAFDLAVEKDESLSETAQYYKALAQVQQKNYREAKSAFRKIITADPATDLAAFADEYIDAIKMTEKAQKPYRAYFLYSLQYDDNVILKPTDDALAGGVGEEDDGKSLYKGYAEYTYKPFKNFGLKGAYDFYLTKHFDMGFYDTLSHDVSVQPTFYLKNSTVAFPVNYNYVGIDDRRYMEKIGAGNVNNIMCGKTNMAQIHLQYYNKDYKWDVTNADNRRDADEYKGALAWYYFFGRNNSGFLNFRYTLSYDEARGSNWDYLGNRFTLSASVPVFKKLKWFVVGDYFRQDFANTDSVYNVERDDNVYTISNLLTYNIYKNAEMQLQHTYVDDDANIGVYKYDKHIYSVGVKVDF
ncbi:tetratricopeptide repeat protein [Candidatus Omnitrophota bacterium]